MNVGELSTILVWGATSSFAIAFFAFTLDLARRADATGVRRREAVAGGASDGSGIDEADLATAADADTAVPGTGGTGGADDAEAPGPGYRPGRAVGIAMALTVLGAAFQLAGIVLRAIAAERVPWANMYEFTVVGTFVAVVTFLVLTLRRDLRFLGALVLGLTVVALGLGLTVFYVPAAGVEPALQSYWIAIHVTIAVLATGMFTVAVSASALQLLKDAWENGSPRLAHPRWRLLGQLPPVRSLEGLAFRLNAVGFVLWTFTVIAGAIWAEHAWSRFWGWDPKEVWSLIVWLVYAAYLHARTTSGWSARAVGWFSIAGFAVLIFNFTGVNLLLPGKHSYTGLDLGG